KLISASGPKRSGGYNINERAGGATGDDRRKNMGPSGLVVIGESPSTSRGTLNKVESPQYGEFRYESGHRNFIDFEVPVNGPSKSYRYDARDNLVGIVMRAGESDRSEITAEYPATCPVEKR